MKASPPIISTFPKERSEVWFRVLGENHFRFGTYGSGHFLNGAHCYNKNIIVEWRQS